MTQHSAILIRKVNEPFGYLGNMSPHPLFYEGYEYSTAEALFQCLRFDDYEIQTEIWGQTSPMAAKMKAKKHKSLMVVVPQSEKDVANMEWTLRLKLEQHPKVLKGLIETGDRPIIEDCSARPSKSGLFWGAKLQDGEWVGTNRLGNLWMSLRDEHVAKNG